jgi:hypothetical protein
MSDSTTDYGIIDYSKHIWLTHGSSELKFGSADYHNKFIDMLAKNKQWIIDYNKYMVNPKKQEVVYYIDNHLNIYKEIQNFDVYPFANVKDTHIVCPVLELEGLAEPLTDTMIDVIKESTTRASVIHLYSNQLKKNVELTKKITDLKIQQSVRIQELLEENNTKTIDNNSCKLC